MVTGHRWGAQATRRCASPTQDGHLSVGPTSMDHQRSGDRPSSSTWSNDVASIPRAESTNMGGSHPPRWI